MSKIFDLNVLQLESANNTDTKSVVNNKKNNDNSVFGAFFKNASADSSEDTTEKGELKEISELLNGKEIDLKKLKSTLSKISELFSEMPEEVKEMISSILDELNIDEDKFPELKQMLAKKNINIDQLPDKKKVQEMLDEIEDLIENITGAKVKLSVEKEDKQKKIFSTENNVTSKTDQSEEGTTEIFLTDLAEKYEEKEKNNNKKGSKKIDVEELLNRRLESKQKETKQVVTKEFSKTFIDGEGKEVKLDIKMEITKIDLGEGEQKENTIVFENMNNNKVSNLFERVNAENNDNNNKNDELLSSKENFESAKPEKVFKTIIKNSAFVNKGDSKELNFRLNPEKLGSLKVVIRNSEAGLEVKMFAENSTAKNVLANNLSELKSELNREGVTVTNVEVAVDPDGQNGREGQQEQQKKEKKQKKNRHINFNDIMKAFEVKSPQLNINV